MAEMMKSSGCTCVVIALAMTFEVGCYSWKVVPVTHSSARLSAAQGGSQMLRFTQASGEQVVMSVRRLEFPHVWGVTEGGDERKIDINQVLKVETSEVRAGQTAGVVLAAAAGAAAVIAIVALSVSMSNNASRQPKPKSSQSCPFVYVDRGQGLELAGEAYPGAVFRALQREDLLPLPDSGEARELHVRMANEQPETDWTDLVQLVFVDHDRGTRVVTRGASGPPMLVGAAAGPLWARDLTGRDVTALVRLDDAEAWQSDLRLEHGRVSPALREGVVAGFARPAAGPPVLELTLANSYWLDFVVSRFFALLGDRYGSYARSIDRRSTLRWRAREGVDLAVEVRAGGGWRHVATLPTVGPMAFRRLAVVLDGAGEGPIQVRVSGGLGFWRVDRMALAPRVNGAPDVSILSPAVAVDHMRRSQLPAISEIDGRYHVLARPHEHLDLRFRLPPRRAGQARAVFLRTSGYYVPHPPRRSRASLGTARTIIHREGSLARFGLDLFGAYERLLRQ